MLSSLLNPIKLGYWPFGQSNMHTTLDRGHVKHEYLRETKSLLYIYRVSVCTVKVELNAPRYYKQISVRERMNAF